MAGREYREQKFEIDKGENNHKIIVDHVTIRQSISFLVLRLITIEVIAAVVIIGFHVLLLTTSLQNKIGESVSLFNIPIFLLLVAVKTFIAIFVIIQWLNDYYEITTKEIISRKGLLFIKEERSLFEHIGSVKLEQGIFGRILNFGTLKLYNWTTEKDVLLYLIHNPMKYRKILEDLIPEADRSKRVMREHILEPAETID